MRRIAAFFVSTWLAAAILYLGRHSVPLMALSGVVVFAGLDLFRPDRASAEGAQARDGGNHRDRS
jgi:MFS superfamily sulfate permease-like transporter